MRERDRWRDVAAALDDADDEIMEEVQVSPSPSRRARHGATALGHKVVMMGGHVKGLGNAGFER